MGGQISERKRILVVDNDEREVSDMVAEALAALEVVAVGNAYEARPLIARASFDLVILDILGANGLDLLEDCHANKLPAAVLTPREVEVKSINEAMKRGAKSFFPRDDLHELQETVADLLDRQEKRKSYATRLFRGIGAAFREIWLAVSEDEDVDRDRSSKLPRVYW